MTAQEIAPAGSLLAHAVQYGGPEAATRPTRPAYDQRRLPLGW
jgi:hypothetical protein